MTFLYIHGLIKRKQRQIWIHNRYASKNSFLFSAKFDFSRQRGLQRLTIFFQNVKLTLIAMKLFQRQSYKLFGTLVTVVRSGLLPDFSLYIAVILVLLAENSQQFTVHEIRLFGRAVVTFEIFN